MTSMALNARTWTLEECIRYAKDNNISLQKNDLTRLTSAQTTKQSKAALLPSLSFTTLQNVAYQPWKPSGIAMVQDGQVQVSSTKTSYNGNYSVSANWTVWNGNRNRNTVRQNENQEEQAQQDYDACALTLEEQIAKLYIQILYSKEDIEVEKAVLEAARVNEQRGMAMVEVGSLSKADCSQLTSTRAQDEYNVVQAEGNVRSFTRQLKALLQITDDEPFDVMPMEATDAMALQNIPSQQEVFLIAMEHRPELKKANLAVEAADIQRKIAVGQRMPTIGLNASVGTNSSSLSKDAWGNQVRNNLNTGAGISVSVPILDQRQARTAINKADIQKQNAMLDVADIRTKLYSTIEDYWIQATNNQAQFRSAKASSQAAQDSYELLSEQFQVGLKNIVELQDGKTRVLNARQAELQSKYTTIYNIKMLELYSR